MFSLSSENFSIMSLISSLFIFCSSFFLKLLLNEWMLTSWIFPLSLDFLFAALCFSCVLGDFIDFHITGLVFDLDYSIIPSVCCFFLFVCFILFGFDNHFKFPEMISYSLLAPFLMAASSCFRGLTFSQISPEIFRVFFLNILYYSLFFPG